MVDAVELLADDAAEKPLKHRVPIAIYRWSCPNCGLSNTSTRLALGVPCEKCIKDLESLRLSKKPGIENLHMRIFKVLRDNGMVRNSDLGYGELTKIESSVKEFSRIFRKCVGRDPWSVQIAWAKRILRGSSFALIAPTGVGKTTFGILMAIYLAYKRKFKSILIVPTIPLANQVFRRAEDYVKKLSLEDIDIVLYHSKVSRKKREQAIEKLFRGDFNIFVTTSAFFRNKNNAKALAGKLNFFFVDDVDAILRGGKILYQVLEVMGIGEDIVRKAEEIVSLKARLVFRENDEDLSRMRELKRDIEASRRSDVILVISSATGRARGKRIKVLREIFGFETGSRHDIIRNVIDVYKVVKKSKEMLESASEIMRMIGPGGVIYVPRDLGVKYAEKIARTLSEKTGLRISPLTSKNVKIIDRFAEGKIDAIVGVSTYYGVAVRGIDLPDVIKYAIFLGAPRHRIPLNMEEMDLLDIVRVLELSLDVVDPGRRDEILNILSRILRLIRRSSFSYLREVFSRAMKGSVESSTERIVRSAIDTVNALMADKDFISRLKKNPYTKVEKQKRGNKIYVYIPDWATYIQASGRTSRLYFGGVSKGLSIIFEKDARLLKGLERRLKLVSDEFVLRELKDVNLSEVIKEIERDRENIIKAREGRLHEIIGSQVKELTRTALIVVESPNKARTIAGFFGKPSMREVEGIRVYEVSLGNLMLLITASGGHIYDLAVDDVDNNVYDGSLHGVVIHKGTYIPVYTTIKRCLDCGYQFTSDTSEEKEALRCPICSSQNIKDSRHIIRALRKIALEVDEIYIATDPDTEGEKIAFDIYMALSPYNNKIRRIEFHEVTKRAFINAINNPRNIDLNRVKAQFVRRIEDRWIGFMLSKEVTSHMCNEDENLCPGYRLSAGRVQTPVLGWIVESAREHNKKKFLVIRLEDGGKTLYQLEVPVSELSRIPGMGEKITVTSKLENKWEEDLSPPPPYTTDTMLVDASQYLKIAAPKAIVIAQDLFEAGLITYHRTDSTRVSDVGIEIARSYLSEVGKQELLRVRRWGEEGAHEAIRPTRPIDLGMLEKMIAWGMLDIRLTREHLRLYDLIFRRFIASQSIPARVERCNVLFEIRDKNGLIWRNVSKVMCSYAEPGFLEFYSYPYRVFPKELFERSWELTVKSELFRGDRLYTPGDLVRLMKEKGIGRPSTYAKIVDLILKRYIVKSVFRKTGYLVPSKYGKRVYDYLSNKYGDLVSVERTRRLEEKMDLVERGEAMYEEIISDLYSELNRYNLV